MSSADLDRSRRVPEADEAALRVLIVEDHADGAESMALLLRMYGHDVEIARDGQAALEKARTYRPEVVLLDPGLPTMSGYDVARRVILQQPGLSPLIIALTGFGRAEDRKHSAEAGIHLHLVKPANPEQLRCTLDRFRRVIR